MIKPYITKYNIGFGYGGDGLYGFQKRYWSFGWHRTSSGAWRFHIGRW